jgi:SP family sugar:H+ symporter-like MFS transporter
MWFMPESPRWLLSRGRKEDSLAALRYIVGKKNKDNRAFIEGEYQEIEMRVRESKQLGKSHFWDAFKPDGKVLYRTLLGFSLQALQQLTGANYFFYYGASIFQSVGISNSYVTQIILGGVNVICTFPGLWFIERFGRRKPLLLGGLWQCAWLIVFAAVGSQLDPNTRGVGAVLITSACMFIAGYRAPTPLSNSFRFASTWGPGIWVAIGEMFPLHVRSYSASFATAGNWSWNFLLTFFTPFITSAIQFRYGYVFAGCNLLAVIVVFFFYYESAGLNLEQVDAMYTASDVKPWTSSSISPRKPG